MKKRPPYRGRSRDHWWFRNAYSDKFEKYWQIRQIKGDMSTQVGQDLIRLRAIVGFLGEESQCGWWDTSFLSETGQRFLERPFPRSALMAGLHSVTVAARRLHDASVGKGDVVHLFRLSPAKEREVSDLLRDLDSSQVLGDVRNRETALEVLNDMSRVVSGATGAVRVGRRDDLLTSDGLGQIAGYYHKAVVSDEQVFPYFSNA